MPKLRNRNGKALSWVVVLMGFVLALLDKDLNGFALIASAAAGTLNLASAAGRANYKPPPGEVEYGD